MSNNNTNNNGGRGMASDEDEDRISLLAEGLDKSLNVDDNASVTSSTSKPATKGGLARLKANRSASGNQNPNIARNENMSTGMSGAGSAAMPPNSSSSQNVVTGTNIGSSAAEPSWTQQQLQEIANKMGQRLGVVQMSETRRSYPDPGRKYLTTGADGTVVTRPAAILPNPSTNEYQIGVGTAKPDKKTGQAKQYVDVVMKGPNWVLNQWTSKNVIMEGVPQNILDKNPRMTGGRPERRIGHDFARIGLPKESFAPIFETLKGMFSNILDGISTTQGYYWLNASWGVTGSPGKFVYRGANGTSNPTHKLYEAMKMIMGSSSMGAAAIAISIDNESVLDNGKLVSAGHSYGLSVKIHNMFHMKKVPYHSPPQASSVGFEMSDDMFGEVETLEQVSNMGVAINSTASAFDGGSVNPFLNAFGSMGGNSTVGPTEGRLLS